MYLTQLLLSHSDSHAHLHVLLRFLSACALSVQMFGRPSSARASAGSSTRCSPALLSSSLWPRLPSPSSSAVGFPPSVFFFRLSSAKIHLSLHSSCRRLIRKREAGGGGREGGGRGAKKITSKNQEKEAPDRVRTAARKLLHPRELPSFNQGTPPLE